jgi:hypothetical protein
MPPLITVCLEVRILPGPPRSLSNRKISLRLAKGPQLAGFDVGGPVSAETFSRPEPILGHLSLRGGIPFPGRTIIGSEGLALVPDLARREAH